MSRVGVALLTAWGASADADLVRVRLSPRERIDRGPNTSGSKSTNCM